MLVIGSGISGLLTAALLSKRVLEETGVVKYAIRVLALLSYDSEIYDTIIDWGGLDLLVQVIRESTVEPVMEDICTIWANICCDGLGRVAFGQSGGLDTLKRIVDVVTGASLRRALMLTISNVSEGPEETNLAIYEAGLLPHVIENLESLRFPGQLMLNTPYPIVGKLKRCATVV